MFPHSVSKTVIFFYRLQQPHTDVILIYACSHVIGYWTSLNMNIQHSQGLVTALKHVPICLRFV